MIPQYVKSILSHYTFEKFIYMYIQVFCDRMKFCGSGAEVSRAADEIPSTPENIFLENYYTGK